MSSFILMPPGALSPTVFLSSWTLDHVDSIFQCLTPERKDSERKLIKIPAPLYEEMDAGAKAGLANLLMMETGQPVLYARDNKDKCYYLGAVRDFVAQGGMLVNVAGAPEPIFMQRSEQPAIPAKIPRPPNAYILYRKERHQSVKARRPDITNNEISQVLGRLWNSETREVRAYYKRLADEKKEEHRRQYPDYQYRPRRPSERRRRAGATTVTAQVATDGTQQDNA